jgi:hypothetical protein
MWYDYKLLIANYLKARKNFQFGHGNSETPQYVRRSGRQNPNVNDIFLKN